MRLLKIAKVSKSCTQNSPAIESRVSGVLAIGGGGQVQMWFKASQGGTNAAGPAAAQRAHTCGGCSGEVGLGCKGSKFHVGHAVEAPGALGGALIPDLMVPREHTAAHAML